MATTKNLANIVVRCIPDNYNGVPGVVNTKRVRFDIETFGKEEGKKRIPLNLVLVLDCSGSMESDNKLVFAKKAAQAVLNLLHDDDVIHLVTYESSTSIIFENARASSRQHLYGLIDDIETAGSTNMSAGIELGASLLEKYTYDGFARRMFLFSDGQANVGLKTCKELTNLVAQYHAIGITTDSFGIGADFDSQIMKGIGDAGGSRFYFLSSPEMIEVMTKNALVSLFGVCASRVRLVIRGKNGAVVSKIWGTDDLIAGASIGDLHENNLRSVLCEFTTSTSAEGEIETLVYQLIYQSPQDLESPPIVITDSLRLKFVDDSSLVQDIDPRVKIIHASQMAAEIDKKIALLVNDGKRKEALDLVESQIKLLNDVKSFDDERGTVSLLIRLAEHMQKKLKDETVDKHIISKGYQHHAYLKEECDCEDMGFGLFD